MVDTSMEGDGARGVPRVVAELLEVEDLRSLVAREGPLDPERAAGYVADACHALAEAHALGIVHRHLEPAKLLLARRRDGSHVIEVVDVGAAADARDVVAPRRVAGSRTYLAPEQILAPRSVDALADVWALGAILYYLLTGRDPFAGASVEEMTLDLLCEPPPPILDVRPDVPRVLVAVVARCLERDRAKRYPTVIEVLRALRPAAYEPHPTDCTERSSFIRISIAMA